MFNTPCQTFSDPIVSNAAATNRSTADRPLTPCSTVVGRDLLASPGILLHIANISNFGTIKLASHMHTVAYDSTYHTPPASSELFEGWLVPAWHTLGRMHVHSRLRLPTTTSEFDSYGSLLGRGARNSRCLYSLRRPCYLDYCCVTYDAAVVFGAVSPPSSVKNSQFVSAPPVGSTTEPLPNATEPCSKEEVRLHSARLLWASNVKLPLFRSLIP